MTRVILVLLGSFGLVLTLAVAFVVLYRRHARQLRRLNRSLDQLTSMAANRRRVLAYPLPNRWILVRTSNTPHLRQVLGLANEPPVGWSEALVRSRERGVFVSAPVDGWSLLIGGGLPDPATDPDPAFRFLMGLSGEFGDVQAFGLDRVLNFHSWARLRDGAVVRAYAWSGETVWNQGRMTLDERLLGLCCWDYGVQPEAPGYGEVAPVLTNTERVPLLARRWGLDLLATCEILLSQEAVQSGQGDSSPDAG